MWLLLLLVLADTTTSRAIAVAPAETLAVTIQGDGPAIAFVPGLFGSAYGFRGVVPELVAQGYQTIVIEPLGVGASGRPADADYSLAAQAGRVLAVMDTLGIERVVLVAHSLGGGIAFRVAVLRPELVRAVVSIEAGPVEEATTPGFRVAMRFAGLLRRFGNPDLLRAEVRRNLRAASADPAWVTDSVIDGYTAGPAEDFGATIDAFEGMAAAREPWVLGPRIGEITCPVSMLLGGAPHRSAPSPEEVTLLATSLTTFRADTIPGAGHFLFEERPGAVVAAIGEVADHAFQRVRLAEPPRDP